MNRIDKSDIQLTVLIPFMNEGEEVAATVADVRRTAGKSVDIVVLNDCSTDGYAYEEKLRPYDVRYVCNPKNLGSAPSRDVCVDLCETPYFLFLDAHMRFFCNDWVGQITERLVKDDRRLLCGQTLPLTKDEKGVRITEKYASTFGAYMPLNRNDLQPDIKWNGIETAPSSDEQEIPMILGAAYAGSTRYWKYLRGMEGMQRYGTEEQSVSLKAWLEGGRCVLLKKVVLGHIYRKKSPFKRYSEVELFNKLWLVSLLFPPTLKAKSFAIAQTKDSDTFNRALEIFRSKQTEYTELKNYYSKTFTQSFERIVQINKPLVKANIKQKNFTDTLNKLPEVATFLKANTADNYGLFNGRMGQILWLEHYSRYAKDEQYDNLATSLWDSINHAVTENLLPWYFSTGLTGIGWALYYLYDKGFVDELPEEIFSSIDEVISTLDFDNISDQSLNTGLAGLLAYCGARYRFSDSKLYDKNFLECLAGVAERVIKESHDFYELSFAYYLKELIVNGKPAYDIPMSISDIMEYQYSFAENKEYWNNTILGAVLSTTLKAMNYINA